MRCNQATKIINRASTPFHMLRTPFFLAVPLMLAGVAFAQKVQTDYDKSLDFSKFHTYAWREHPILRNNPQIGETFSVAISLVRSEINRDLTSKNYTRAEGKPDFWVTLYVDAQVSDQVDGTLMIDIIDGFESRRGASASPQDARFLWCGALVVQQRGR